MGHLCLFYLIGLSLSVDTVRVITSARGFDKCGMLCYNLCMNRNLLWLRNSESEIDMADNMQSSLLDSLHSFGYPLLRAVRKCTRLEVSRVKTGVI